MKKELIKLANHLDKIGRIKEADYIDDIIKRSFALPDLPEFPELNMSSMFESSFNAIIRNLKEDLVRFTASGLGILDEGLMLEFIANIVGGLEVDEIYQIVTNDAVRCELVAKEVSEAVSKTLLEEYVTKRVQESLEESLSGAINNIFGIDEGGTMDRLVKALVSQEMTEEVITKYLTEDNIITNKISEFICDFIENYEFPGFSDLKDSITQKYSPRDVIPDIVETGFDYIEPIIPFFD